MAAPGIINFIQRGLIARFTPKVAVELRGSPYRGMSDSLEGNGRILTVNFVAAGSFDLKFMSAPASPSNWPLQVVESIMDAQINSACSIFKLRLAVSIREHDAHGENLNVGVLAWPPT
jgi:hypothetical protein